MFVNRRSSSIIGKDLIQALVTERPLACRLLAKERGVGKTDFVRSTKRLCADSRDLIDQSAVLVSGSGAACAVHKDQIATSKEAVAKSRKQISHLQSRKRCEVRNHTDRDFGMRSA